MFWYQKIILMANLAQTAVKAVKEIKESKKPNNHKDGCKCVVCKRKKDKQ